MGATIESFDKGRHDGYGALAYLFVHSLASVSYFARSVLYNLAISGTNGSSGLGSPSRLHMERSTLEIVSAGDHWERSISKHIEPLLFILGW